MILIALAPHWNQNTVQKQKSQQKFQKKTQELFRKKIIIQFLLGKKYCIMKVLINLRASVSPTLNAVTHIVRIWPFVPYEF